MPINEARLLEVLHKLAHPSSGDVHKAIDELADDPIPTGKDG